MPQIGEAKGQYRGTTVRNDSALAAWLAKRPGEAVARAWLATNVLDPDREGSERALDVHVSRLRKKLGDPKWIETVWGIGYRLGISR